MTVNMMPMKELDARLDLLCKVGRQVTSVSELSVLIGQIMDMTEQTLKASASSVLLFDEEKQELVFEFANGAAGQTLKKMRLSAKTGIAGWVAHQRRPLIVNDVANDRRFHGDVDRTTGFITRSIMGAPLLVRGKLIGVIEVLNKLDGTDFDEHDLGVLESVAATAAMAIENARLHQAVIDGYKRTVMALAAAVDAKDPYTCGHSQRVMQYALLAGRSLLLLPEELETLGYAAILHDIGKIGIADPILRKSGSLTPEEWVEMYRHPAIGFHMTGDVPFLENARALILHHHERYDGTGYPDGLSKEDIPLGSRLIAVADAFDTMTTDRAYRPSIGISCALRELYSCCMTQFCPTAVDAFVSGFKRARKLSLIRPS